MVLVKVTFTSILVLLITFTLAYIVLSPYYATLSAAIPSSKATNEDIEDESDDTSTPCDESLLPIPLDPNFTLNITHHAPSLPIPSSPLPQPHALADAAQAIPLLLSLSRSTTWSSIANITLRAPDTFEPEGLLRLGPDRFLLSAGEYTTRTKKYPPSNPIQDGTDRTPGAGFAHLMMFTSNGTLVADASISLSGSLEYHNGGLDYDGESIWGVLSQYRPNTSATVYAADPTTLRPRAVLHHPSDHLGAIAVPPAVDLRPRHGDEKHGSDRRISTLNWGGRTASLFPLPDTDSCVSRLPRRTIRNPSHFVDYQDCKYMGPWSSYTLMLCSGVASLGNPTSSSEKYNLGGIALVDIDTMQPLAEIPVTLESEKGVRMTQNPMDFSVEDGKLRFYWAPDQHESTLYIYEAQP